jgi:hypothetical protein
MPACTKTKSPSRWTVQVLRSCGGAPAQAAQAVLQPQMSPGSPLAVGARQAVAQRRQPPLANQGAACSALSRVEHQPFVVADQVHDLEAGERASARCSTTPWDWSRDEMVAEIDQHAPPPAAGQLEFDHAFERAAGRAGRILIA